MAGLETVDEMNDLRMSEDAKVLFDKVKAFIKEEVDPITLEFHQLGENREDRWSWAPGQLELLDGVKAKAKAMDLWNFFLPDDATGQVAGKKRKNPSGSVTQPIEGFRANQSQRESAASTSDEDFIEPTGPGDEHVPLELRDAPDDDSDSKPAG